MACLRPEQFAHLVLEDDEQTPDAPHVDQCDACRAVLSELRHCTSTIVAAHSEPETAHAKRRVALLASLPDMNSVNQPASARQRLPQSLTRLSPIQKIAVSGLGLSTAAALLVLIFIFANSATSLSAMERMAQQLQEVTSYSYKLVKESSSKPGARSHSLIVQRTDTTSWQAPDPSQPKMLGSMRAETKIIHIRGAGPAAESSETVHIEEAYPSGNPGLFIDYLAKTYFRTPPATAEHVPADSPLRMLQVVREGAGDLIADLGTKRIDGKVAHGYSLQFKRAVPFRTLDSVEVWIDPATDLPIEFSYAAENETRREVFRVYDCRWNPEFAPGHFRPTPPVGFDDITPPSDPQAINQIVAALRTYAEVSGGFYPAVTTFDAEAIRNEMLNLAGFSGAPQALWKNDDRFQRIERATAGLQWIEHVLRREHHSGYYGTTVGPTDAKKALLWWTVDAADSYRVVYGDLRTDLLPVEQWAKSVPEDVAADHLPLE